MFEKAKDDVLNPQRYLIYCHSGVKMPQSKLDSEIITLFL